MNLRRVLEQGELQLLRDLRQEVGSSSACSQVQNRHNRPLLNKLPGKPKERSITVTTSQPPNRPTKTKRVKRLRRHPLRHHLERHASSHLPQGPELRARLFHLLSLLVATFGLLRRFRRPHFHVPRCSTYLLRRRR